MADRALHLRIAGRVQGVGYRAWLEAEAVQLGLSGWARNLRDGSVEAVIAGPAPAVDTLLAACRNGPRHARVEAIEAQDTDAPAAPGFEIRPTL